MKDLKNKIQSLSIKNNNDWRKETNDRRDKKWLIYSSEIALRILALIEENEELNQTKLAETLNISRQQINKIIQGKENLTLETIYKLSKALNFELIIFPPYKDSYMLGSMLSARAEVKHSAFNPYDYLVTGSANKITWKPGKTVSNDSFGKIDYEKIVERA